MAALPEASAALKLGQQMNLHGSQGQWCRRVVRAGDELAHCRLKPSSRPRRAERATAQPHSRMPAGMVARVSSNGTLGLPMHMAEDCRAVACAGDCFASTRLRQPGRLLEAMQAVPTPVHVLATLSADASTTAYTAWGLGTRTRTAHDACTWCVHKAGALAGTTARQRTSTQRKSVPIMDVTLEVLSAPLHACA
jgi:hypothetical protein